MYDRFFAGRRGIFMACAGRAYIYNRKKAGRGRVFAERVLCIYGGVVRAESVLGTARV